MEADYRLDMRATPSLVLTARLVLAGLFLFAGISKALNVTAFADSIGSYEILHVSTLPAIAVTIIWHELLCGLLLVVGFWTRSAALLLTVMLGSFLFGMASALVRGFDMECGCFGDMLSTDLGWLSMTRTFLILCLVLLLLYFGSGAWALDARVERRKGRRAGDKPAGSKTG